MCPNWSERLRADGELRIGICWQGNPSYEADYQRSIPLIQFAALGELKGMRLYALQKHHGRDQLDRLDGSFAVHDLGRELDSDGHAFLDTAAAIANLDLVITSDTAVAHLAGALAAEVWLLLPHAPDWRWGLTGDRTPWYPTMRLFRQPTPGDWRGVFDRVLTKLGERTP